MAQRFFKKFCNVCVYFFLIEIWLIYNAVLVFDIQQSDLAIHIYVCVCIYIYIYMGFPGYSVAKNLPAMQESCVWSLDQEDPLEEAWQLTPIFLPGKSQGLRSLVGYRVHGGSKTWTQLKQLNTHGYLCVCVCVCVYSFPLCFIAGYWI